MTEPPPPRVSLSADLDLRTFRRPDLEAYRTLFRRVGEYWLWTSRLVMPDEELHAILADPQVEITVLYRGDDPIGLLELDFRQAAECELAFFGLVREAFGQGAGRFLMNAAIAKAWGKPIRRFWVHTCHFDHPNALGFYRRSGFEPYSLMVEIHDDPRLAGKLPRHASPHVALIDPK